MNSVHETSWVPGLAVLAGSLLLAMIYLLFAKKGAAALPAAGVQVDLDERYLALLGQLKEHALSKHLMTPEAWAAEQTRLEHAAAAVLKQRTGDVAQLKHEALKTQARAEKKAAAAPSFFSRHPVLTGAIAGGGVVLFFGALGLLLVNESKPRAEGRGMTGADPNAKAGTGAGKQRGPMQADPRLATLRARVERSPDDVDTLAEAAGEYMKRQQFDDAYPLVVQASGIDPFHVKTRIYRTVLEAVAGSPPEQAVTELEHIADTFEGAYEARLYAGSLALEMKQTDHAIAQFERYLVEAPISEQPPMIRRSVEMMKAQQAGQPAQKAP